MAHTAILARQRLRTGLTLFRIAGIDIHLDLSWVLIFLLVLWSLSAGYLPLQFPDQGPLTYWATGFVATVLFFFSIVAHELSHALVAIRAGIQVPRITLFLFGGIAHTTNEAKGPATEFSIAIVGPLTSFALAGLFWITGQSLPGHWPTMVVVVCDYLARINLLLGLFNLVPGYPLDGGRVFRALWWWKTGSLVQATRVAADIGKGFAITLMIIGGIEIFSGLLVGGLWLLFIGMFLRGIAEESYQQLLVRRTLETIHAREAMIPNPVTVPPELPVNRLVDEFFLRHGYRGFPVASDGRIHGLVTLDHVKGIPREDQHRKTVGQVMAPLTSTLIIGPDGALSDGLQRMAEAQSDRLLVMDRGRMIGMLTSKGLVRFLDVRQSLSV